MTVTYNFTLLSTSQIIELKNCSNSLACDPDFSFSCKYTLPRIFGFKLVIVVFALFCLYVDRERPLFSTKSIGKNAKNKAKQVSGRERVIVICEGANRT